MSKTSTAKTNRIRSRMQSARHLAITNGGGIHIRKTYAIRPKAVAEKKGEA